MSLSTEQRAAFAEDGWLVIRDAFEPARVAALETALESVVPETQYARGYAAFKTRCSSSPVAAAKQKAHCWPRL